MNVHVCHKIEVFHISLITNAFEFLLRNSNLICTKPKICKIHHSSWSVDLEESRLRTSLQASFLVPSLAAMLFPSCFLVLVLVWKKNRKTWLDILFFIIKSQSNNSTIITHMHNYFWFILPVLFDETTSLPIMSSCTTIFDLFSLFYSMRPHPYPYKCLVFFSPLYNAVNGYVFL